MASPNVSIKNILITGLPGVGKTTIIKKIHEHLTKSGIICSGFFTEEIRIQGQRVGFDVVTTDNNRGQLARLSSDMVPEDGHKLYQVGKYVVNLHSFEMIALPALLYSVQEKNRKIFIIDEIGKMELFSHNFIQTVKKLMSEPNIVLIATIPVSKGKPLPLVEELRANPLSQVIQVSHKNRNDIINNIMAEVNSCINAPKF